MILHHSFAILFTILFFFDIACKYLTYKVQILFYLSSLGRIARIWTVPLLGHGDLMGREAPLFELGLLYSPVT